MDILFYCQKRDGSVVPFDKKYIVNAISSAFLDSQEGNPYVARQVTESVCDALLRRFRDKIPNVEDIQDAVEEQLIYLHFVETARDYINYRNKHKEMRLARQGSSFL